jgi:hypothetical protein
MHDRRVFLKTMGLLLVELSLPRSQGGEQS